MNNDRKVVLGLGNLLQTDEGFGIHAMFKLRDQLGEGASNIEFLDGGVLGLNLLPIVEGCSHLLVFDAVLAGLEPGGVVEMQRDEIPLYSDDKLSEHQVLFQEVLGLAHIRGTLPVNLHLLGVQPGDLRLGVELSEPVATALPEVMRRAEACLQNWNLLG